MSSLLSIILKKKSASYNKIISAIYVYLFSDDDLVLLSVQMHISVYASVTLRKRVWF